MKILDVIKKFNETGKWPKVKIDVKMRHATSDIGVIQEIKPNGIGVVFPGQKWNAWFWENDQNDNRTKCMSQLTFVETEASENCREDIKQAMPKEERIKAADKLGPNWANIMSGLGDQ